MKEEDFSIKKLLDIKNKLIIEKPLIHCITNHITINDCANVVLAIGGKPIMAENKREVSDITTSAKALAVNLGNISDNRMISMMISGEVAYKNNIPSIIDIVGVNCSNLRLKFALEFINKCKPNVIKGNMSEIKAVLGLVTNSKGVDVNDEDNTTEKTINNNINIVKNLSNKTNSIVVATGEIDLISNGNETYVIENGCIELSMITGTGCMLNALIATCISSGFVLEGAILGTLIMGISGELSNKAKGTASFKVDLLDNISTINDKDIIEKSKIRVVE
ncbi:hydroxyethylthiazole kinase [Clostridium tertium]|uniref:Hydroxyethylthiazole kinase n=1 Tax=Clostridium tertium TaxID=1559 RepID=A0A6N3ESK4_9CLOT